MDLQQPSADFRPKNPKERRERRAKVEALMVRGRRYVKICEDLAEEFGVTPRTVHADIRMIRERWARETTAKADQRRERIIRGLEANAEKCWKSDDMTGHMKALSAAGRMLGMGVLTLNQTVNQDNRRGVFINVERMPQGDDEQQAWLDEYVACRDEYRGRLPEKVVDVEAHETNGHE